MWPGPLPDHRPAQKAMPSICDFCGLSFQLSLLVIKAP
jgi:hypothetical protein